MGALALHCQLKVSQESRSVPRVWDHSDSPSTWGWAGPVPPKTFPVSVGEPLHPPPSQGQPGQDPFPPGSVGLAWALLEAVGWDEGAAHGEPCLPWDTLIACNGESVISSNP